MFPCRRWLIRRACLRWRAMRTVECGLGRSTHPIQPLVTTCSVATLPLMCAQPSTHTKACDAYGLHMIMLQAKWPPLHWHTHDGGSFPGNGQEAPRFDARSFSFSSHNRLWEVVLARVASRLASSLSICSSQFVSRVSVTTPSRAIVFSVRDWMR